MFLIISILFMFSCNNLEKNKTDNSNNGNSNSYISSDDENKINDSVAENNSNVSSENSDGAYSEDGGFALFSYDEYLEYVKNNEFSGGFLYYEDIKQFGEFCSLSAPVGISTEPNAEIYYCYNLKYNDARILLLVANFKVNELKDQINEGDIQVNLSDMRYTVSGETGIYFYNNVRYLYVQGELICIKWYENGWTYSINVFNNAHGYGADNMPDNDGSPLAKLIYLE